MKRNTNSRPATDRTPHAGVEIVYRVNEYRSQYAPKRGRYLRGRVLFADSENVAWVLSSQGSRTAALLYVSRPHRGAPWKGAHSTMVGNWAHGGHSADPARWRAIEAAGIVPAAWYAPPQGEPYTMARLRSVSTRLASIGAKPTTVEEFAAVEAMNARDPARAPMFAPDAYLRGVPGRIRDRSANYSYALAWSDPRREAVAAYLERVVAGIDPAILDAAEAATEEPRVLGAIGALARDRWDAERDAWKAAGCPTDRRPGPGAPATLADVMRFRDRSHDTHEGRITALAYDLAQERIARREAALKVGGWDAWKAADAEIDAERAARVARS